jgi:hypothetical protein
MKPGKKFIVIALICLLFSVFGYEYGRHKTPAKIVTVTKTVTLDHDVIHTVTQVQKEVIYVQQQAKDVHRVVIVDKKPTGEVVTTTTVQDNTKTTTGTAAEQVKNQDKAEDHVVYKDREVTKTVINNTRPEWILGLNGGYNLGNRSTNLVPIVPNKIIIGASAQKHILGPIYGGINVNSNEVVGLNLSLEF